MKTLVLKTISLYQGFVSPIFESLFGHACRFNLTCSDYARQKIERYGLTKGGNLALRRLARCHPFTKSSLGSLLR
ncbi:membrane protein insertion efficiency factor YidD [Patescibacteria group bacterium]|nr:membrane protein insertion efficiency factor YidD [Patescibacteria group bacterium]